MPFPFKVSKILSIDSYSSSPRTTLPSSSRSLKIRIQLLSILNILFLITLSYQRFRSPPFTVTEWGLDSGSKTENQHWSSLSPQGSLNLFYYPLISDLYRPDTTMKTQQEFPGVHWMYFVSVELWPYIPISVPSATSIRSPTYSYSLIHFFSHLVYYFYFFIEV